MVEGQLPLDRELYELLKEDDFEGPRWRRFSERCAGYALLTFRPAVVSGRVWIQGRKKGYHGFGGQRDPVDLDDANEITNEVVVRALASFRKDLRAGKWSPDGGRGLNGFFYEQCLFQLPNVYRLSTRSSPRALPLSELPDQATWDKRQDPAVWAEITEEVEHRLGKITTDQVRHMFVLRACGYRIREIAEDLGLTVRAVENALRRNQQSSDEW